MSTIENPLAALGRSLRGRRQAQGLSQVDAARRAGVGRSTLIHLENGAKDVRLSNALAVARVVGTSIGLQDQPPEISQRRQWRAEDSLRLARRHAAHLRLAVCLALEKKEAVDELAEARQMVDLWKRNRTCSPFYVRAWSGILKGKPRQVAERIRAIDPSWLDALLQNTPFSRIVKGL